MNIEESQACFNAELADLLGDAAPQFEASTFPALTNSRSTRHDFTVSSLAEFLSSAAPVPLHYAERPEDAPDDWAKDGPMITFAVYRTAVGFTADDVSHYRGIAVDFDYAGTPSPEGLAAHLEAEGLRGAVATTYSHQPAAPRLRALLPSARPMSVDEAQQLCRFVAETVGGAGVDSASWSRGQRFFYSPVAGREADRRVIAIESGMAVDDWAAGQGFVYAPQAAEARRRVDIRPLDERRGQWLQDRASGRLDSLIAATMARIDANERRAFLDNILHPLHDLAAGQPDGLAYVLDLAKGTDRFARKDARERRTMLGGYRSDWRLATRRDARNTGARKTLGSLVADALAGGWVDDWTAAARALVLEDELPEHPDGPLPEWVKDRRGRVTWNHANAIAALRNIKAWKGVLAWDELRIKIMLTARVPGTSGRFAPRAWRDEDLIAALDWFNRNGFPDATKETLAGVVGLVARDNVISPIRHYLEDLKWDGVARLDGWLTHYLGVDPTPYARAVGRAWLISAVARALKPGCKSDCMLILEGPQGLGKSAALEALCGAHWFSDSLEKMEGKDSAMALSGYWILEVAELAAMNRQAVEGLKAYLTRTTDRYRPPYGKVTVEEPRRCVFAGTVNPNGNGYLRDDTGGRRFWPVVCTRTDVKGIEADRDQLWAEAVAAYRAGEKWWLSDDMQEVAKIEQSARAEIDPWEGAVLKHAERLACQRADGAVSTKGILVAMGRGELDMTKGESMRVGGILTRAGWVTKGVFNGRTDPWRKSARYVRGA